ncbi:MAG: UDP-2,4-diacetamido-2,4,6-trideoxy-beta-L-altropyranose hydrolase [Methylobacter sp.]
MNIAIRADASNQIGTGHFMRCLTLADGLKRRGARIRFIGRNPPLYLRDMLEAKGMECVPLASNDMYLPQTHDLTHAHWLGASQEQDAQDAIQALSDDSWDWLIVDHYALDSRWESMLRPFTKKILVIDDIADRQHDCDMLLDQNFYLNMQSRYAGKVPPHCHLLLGPSYALLRDEFRQLREQIEPRTEPVKRVLVFFGGVDAGNYTGRAVEALSGIGAPDLHVDVVIGAQHPNLEQIKTACRQHEFVCHVQTDKMAELMAAASLAIGAAGTASWERCCLGLPCIVGAVAQNQIQAAQDLAHTGAVKFVGTGQAITVNKLQQEINSVLNSDWLNKASKRCLELVDAQGVNRLILSMENL